MNHCLLATILSGLVTAQVASFPTAPASIQPLQSPLVADPSLAGLPVLAAIPKGKSTTIGGQILKVDPVRDQFILKAYGQRPMKILFDERTLVYLDGTKISLRELRPDDHGSVQTVLDGTNVFALSVHMLSRSPVGEYQGHVLSFNPDTRELLMNSAMSRDPLKLTVPMSTVFAREGQTSFSSLPSGQTDLVKGVLISVNFSADNKGQGIASRISILAAPGSAFVFSGSISSIDLHSGSLVILDPRDGKSYQVFLNSSLMAANNDLHEGTTVRVEATFDGSRYIVSAMTIE